VRLGYCLLDSAGGSGLIGRAKAGLFTASVDSDLSLSASPAEFSAQMFR
jgi:hypothetical protein